MNSKNTFDLIIVGAGPAGTSTAIYARKYGLNTLLLDKDSFPRDKICGDAISGKSMMILKELDLIEEASQLGGALIDSVTFGSPNNVSVNISLQGAKRNGMPTGLVVPRKKFDHFLFQKAKDAGAQAIENFKVSDLIQKDGIVAGIKGKRINQKNVEEFHASVIIGADGYNSIVSRKTGNYEHDQNHWVVALRQYWQGVEGLKHQIELHFIDEVQPGYFWIFPAGDGLANVGIGMLHKSLKKRKIDLKKAMDLAIKSPAFKERFKNAKELEKPVGWNLPVGSKHRNNYGDGYLLLGDAAGLIDPFTGEGIGNALYSGREAARVVKEAKQAGDFSKSFLKRYDQRLWEGVGGDLKLSSKLQKVGRSRTLLNLVVNKAAKNKEVSELISGMMADQVPKSKLTHPLFYLRLLFN